MLYYFLKFLHENYDLPGSGLYQFITFRAIAAAILSLLIGTIFGKKIIRFLQKKQIIETIRDLNLKGENLKAGTPTMGGLIILLAILIPVLLFAKIENIYILLLLATSIWLGLIGFTDDYVKVFLKNKKGLRGRAKVVGQIGLGLIIGLVMYWHKDVRIREFEYNPQAAFSYEALINAPYKDIKSLKTTIPFFKGNEFDYRYLVPDSLGEVGNLTLYLVLVTFIVIAVSNGANITDGLDGLAAGTSAIVGVTLGILAYVSGNVLIAKYLNIMYLPDTGEILVFCTAFVGACIAFLWYNSFPAQIFMGDTGSLALGGIIATLAIVLRKELMIPIICGIFLVENLSVMLQVSYFKYTKKKYGEGRRIFLMSPLHHHYQKKGYHEAKIVTRFWIVGIILAILAIATLKIR
jgi:phospho-N-acetylmuramoyl-pentapeptide-transferase